MSFDKSHPRRIFSWRIFSCAFIKVLARTLESFGTCSHTSCHCAVYCLLQIILSVWNNHNRTLVNIFNGNSRVHFRLLILLEGISISSDLSSKQLRYISMMTSSFLGLKEDLGLNLSVTKDRSSSLICP